MSQTPSTPSGDSLPPIPNDPFTPYVDDRAERISRWRIVFGSISLVVAVFGFCTQGALLSSLFANAWMMKRMGIDAPPPPDILVWTGGVQAIILVLLGILLTAGSAMLLARKPLGAKFVLAWAVSRLVMVFVGAAVAVVTIKPQAEWAVELTASMRESFRAQGFKEEQLPPLIDQAKAESDGIRNIAIFSVAFATWPFVMAIVLTRPKVKEDIARWGRG
jgi:hypothetical protein